MCCFARHLLSSLLALCRHILLKRNVSELQAPLEVFYVLLLR